MTKSLRPFRYSTSTLVPPGKAVDRAGFQPASAALLFPGQSGRQESNLPPTAYQTVAAPRGFGPKEAPCTGIEPVSPVRQTGWHPSSITGQNRTSSCGWDRTSVGLRQAELTAPCDYQQSPHRNLSQQPVLVSSQLDRGSEPPSPAEGLAKSRSCRSRTCQSGFRRPSARSRETTHSTPCQSRTGQPAFGGPVLGAARQGNVRVFGGS